MVIQDLKKWVIRPSQAVGASASTPEQRFCLPAVVQLPGVGADHNGGSVRVLRGFRGHSACCRSPAPMPVDPALTALWPQDRSSGLHGPALPDMDFRNRASSNVLSNIVSESGSTDFVEDLVKLQAEAAGDDFFLDLGGAAEDRLEAAVSPGPARRDQTHVATAAVQLNAAGGGQLNSSVAHNYLADYGNARLIHSSLGLRFPAAVGPRAGQSDLRSHQLRLPRSDHASCARLAGGF